MEQTEPKLKLSDYMRQGIKQTDRLEGDYLETGWARLKACAVGAACYARDPQMYQEPLSCDLSVWEAYDYFPELSDSVPETDLDLQRYHPSDLGEFIMVLNDKLHWRRDKIAGYVKKLGY